LANLDLSDGLTDLVPFPLRVAAQQLGDRFTADIKEQLEPAIHAQLDSDLVTQTWERASREVHDQLVDELSSHPSAATIPIDLHDVLVRAIHDLGTKLQQTYSSIPYVSEIIDGIGEAIPSSVGVVPVDVSNVKGPARTAIAHASDIEVAAFATGAVALVLALLVSRRRGLTVLMFGVGLLLTAVVGYGLFAYAFDGAGATVAAQSNAKVSADVQQIIDIQADLIVASYRPWAVGVAGAGIAIGLVGAVWAAARSGSTSNRRPTPALAPSSPPVASAWQMPSAPPVR
jgi:hypothetical protein